MKKLTPLNSKLASYSALAAAFIAGRMADAQIVYTDVDSDAVIHAGIESNNWYYVDLNNDQHIDIGIADAKDTYGYYYIIDEKLYGAKIAMYRGGGLWYPLVDPLSFGAPIQSDLPGGAIWRGYGYIQWGGIGYFAGQGDKYLGIRIDVKEHNYKYGWIRLTVDKKSDLFVVKDFAFNNVLNQPILAGQTSPCADGYEDNNSFSKAREISSGLIYHPLINPAGDLDYFKFNVQQRNLRVRLFDLPANFDLKLYDANHQLVGSSLNTGMENDTIIYNDIPAGDYYIKVMGGNNQFDSVNCYSLKVETSATPFGIITEINPAEINKALHIFPNPSAGNIMVEYAAGTGNVQFIIHNMTGKVVYNRTEHIKNSYRFEVSNLNSGIYLLQARTGNNVSQTKFVVAK